MKKQTRLTTRDIRAHKGHDPLVVLTAYTAPFASILDEHADILLVGDSLGMVLYGLDTTLGVTPEMMILHGQAVMRSSRKACVVVDMPFGSYQQSAEQAFEQCARVMAQTGCTAIKLEGGEEMAETIHFLTQRGIPVMGHVGLTPQHVHQLGGFRTRGREEATHQQILADAKAVESAGAFCMVIEGVYTQLGKEITDAVSIPTIGIGAGLDCDGQVLVSEDMAGLNGGYMPKFVKQYGAMGDELQKAASLFAQDVRGRAFPSEAFSFVKKDTEVQ